MSSQQPGLRVFKRPTDLLPFAGVGVFLVGAMGYPAVLMHFSDFKIPTTFLTLEVIVRAGIWPAVLMAFAVLIVYWGAQQGKERKYIAILRTLQIPMSLLAGTGVVVYSLSVSALMGWGTYWLVVNLRYGWAVAIVTWVPYLSLLYWLWPVFRRIENWWLKALRSFAGVPFFVGAFYLFKVQTWVVWDPGVPGLLDHDVIVPVGIAVGLGLAWLSWVPGLFEDGEQWRPGESKTRWFQLWIGTVVGFSVASIFLYTTVLYPIIPQGFGGGRPEAVQVWVQGQDAEVLQTRIPGATCAKKGQVTACSGIYLVFAGGDVLVFAGAKAAAGPVVVMARGRIQALSR